MALIGAILRYCQKVSQDEWAISCLSEWVLTIMFSCKSLVLNMAKSLSFLLWKRLICLTGSMTSIRARPFGFHISRFDLYPRMGSLIIKLDMTIWSCEKGPLLNWIYDFKKARPSDSILKDQWRSNPIHRSVSIWWLIKIEAYLILLDLINLLRSLSILLGQNGFLRF